MESIDILSMFMLGILATGHCIGMCGPIIIAFPGRTGQFRSHLFYHLGRVTTYALVGAIMAGIGRSLPAIAAATSSDPLVWVARGKIIFATLAGIFLVGFGVSRFGIIPEPAWMGKATPSRIPGYQAVVRSAFRDGKPAGMILLGLMMGLLPCGLSYGAFARALPAESIADGFLLTAAFGLGTTPGLLVLGTGAGMLVKRYQRAFDILSGVLMIGIGLKLLARAVILLRAAWG